MKKWAFRALATALLLPGALVALVAVSVLIGVLLALCWYVQLFRAICDYARSLMPNAREINDARSERPPLAEGTSVRGVGPWTN